MVVYEVATGRRLCTIQSLGWGGVRFAPHSTVMLVFGRESDGSELLFRTYDARTGTLLWKLDGVTGFADTRFMSGDRSFLVPMRTPDPNLHAIVEIDLATGNIIRTLFEDINYEIALSPSGRWLATSSEETYGVIRVWRLA